MILPNFHRPRTGRSTDLATERAGQNMFRSVNADYHFRLRCAIHSVLMELVGSYE